MSPTPAGGWIRSDAVQRSEPLRPPKDFPTTPDRDHDTWYRNHRQDNGAWYFASRPSLGNGGRFDLAAPDGTCYVADTEIAAAMEFVGPDLQRFGYITAESIKDRVVTPVEVDAGRIADLNAPTAHRYGVTGELANNSDYAPGQAWADTFRGAGFDGIEYTPRFTPGGRAQALFGRAGPDLLRVEHSGSARTIAAVLDESGFPVRPTAAPSLSALQVSDPGQ